MKLPNNYGTVAKLSGNRRRSYVVREGVSGSQKAIGYASTREEGLLLLAKFNQDPWSVDKKAITLSQLFQLWLEKKSDKLGKSSQNSLKSAYNHCETLKQTPYADIKAYQMQACIDGCRKSYATQSTIKNLFFHLDKLALELDVITKGYSGLLETEPIPDTKKTVFTKEERGKIWNIQDSAWVDSLLIFLYTGFRISEILSMKKTQVDLGKQILTGGGKTEAGRNRTVPIHPNIRSFIETRMRESGDYLLCLDGQPLTDSQYRKIWKSLMLELGFSHTPHECRHTFRSMLDSAGANPVCIDRLMGHKSKGTGERIYTHKTIEELRFAILLITN